MKPVRIAVDWDSTLADTLKVVLDLMNFKYPDLHLKREEIVVWDWPHLIADQRGMPHEQLEKDFWAIFDMLDTTHLRRSIPPVDPLACGAVKWLVKRGHDVHIVTSNRPEAEMSIRAWNFGHGLNLPLDMLGRKSPREKAELDFDVYIDDSPALAEAVESIGKTLLLVPQPFNREVRASLNVWTTFSWRHAVDIFEQLGL